MNLFIHLLIFIIVILSYLHIIQQYKTSEDLEIYELDYTDNNYLQEICNVKQPAVFYYKDICPEFFDSVNSDTLDDKEIYDVKIKDVQDYWNNDIESVDYILLPYKSSQVLMKTDTHGNYITEENEQFVEDSGLYSHFQMNDELLKPSFTVQTKYDIMTGSQNSVSPFRYHTNNRYFICVNSGKIRVKLTPWKSSKYLYPIKDFENYEFRSPINPWTPQRRYFVEMDKMKFLEFDLNEGQVLYIPSYWWFSIKYINEFSIVSGFTYNSVMSTIANSKDIGLYMLQQSNTKTKIAKTIDLSTMNNTSTDESNNEITTEDCAI